MKAFNKDIVRSIRHSLGRFVAIAAIVALGCGFYAGLRMTAPDMKLAADAYYDGTDLMDIRVVSTLGLTDEDIEALRDVPGVSGVEAAYSADVLATLNDEQYVMRVHSLSPSAATAVKTGAGAISSDDANYLNRLDLVEGRWPTSANECVIFNDRVMSGPSSLGDTVTVDPSVGNVQDTLAETEFTVVGRVHSPLYVSSTSMGTSTIGSGTIEQVMYVLPEAFDADMPYVEAYVSVEGAAELPADSDAYDDRVAGVVAAIEGIAPAREQARVDGLKAEAQADLDEARAEYEKEEARAKTELADARAELDAAKEELDEGQRKLDAAASTLAASEKKIKDGEKEYTQGTESLSKRKADAEAQFAEAEQQVAANEANLAEANAALPTLQDALAQAEAALQVPNLPTEQRAELEATRADLEQKIADIAAAATALEEAKAQLAQERASADAQIAAAQTQLDQAKTSVEEGKKQLEEGKAEYEQAKADLEAGRAEYEQGVADYDTAAAEANEELDKAEQELADAQKEIDDIEPPDWLVMDRTKNFGVVSFASDADRIDAIASFFPFIFFLVAALVALTTLTVQGLFSILEAGAPALVSEILHMALVAGSAACFVRAMGAGACLRVQFEREPYAPMGVPRRRGESQGRHRGAPSFALFLIIGAYGAVFGFLHVVPLALSLDVSSRVTAFLFGAVAALGLFSATLRQSDGTDVVRLWNRFYQYVFPIVTVAALLGPLTMDTEFLPLLILQACALYYFDVLLAVASYTIARVIKASPTQVFARAFLVKSAGFFLGCLVGFGVHESVVLDETAFSVIGAAIFVILSLVTFHTNSEKFAKTVWGLLPHEDAHGKLASRRAECCRRLARSSGLTDREAEILEYLVAGKRPKEISEMLVVSITTVRSHVRAIYAKTGVHSHGELMHLLDEK